MGFWAGALAGAALMLLAVALMLGIGMVAWRWILDKGLGHDWIEEWAEMIRRWRQKWRF